MCESVSVETAAAAFGPRNKKNEPFIGCYCVLGSFLRHFPPTSSPKQSVKSDEIGSEEHTHSRPISLTDCRTKRPDIDETKNCNVSEVSS